MVEVEIRGFDSFVCREGIVEVHMHIFRYQGDAGKRERYIYVSKVDIHGSVEVNNLIIYIRKCRDYIRQRFLATLGNLEV